MGLNNKSPLNNQLLIILYFFSVLVYIFLNACDKMSNKEKLIADYLQTFGDTACHLDFKSKNITFVKSITCKDSANFYDSIALATCKAQIDDDFPDVIAYIERLTELDLAYKKVIMSPV